MICFVFFFFTEKQFLTFFFKRLKKNDSGRYMEDFPYLSLCGKERNFIRCDDLPVVFTHVVEDKKNNQELFSYAHAGESLVVNFFFFHLKILFLEQQKLTINFPGTISTR